MKGPHGTGRLGTAALDLSPAHQPPLHVPCHEDPLRQAGPGGAQDLAESLHIGAQRTGTPGTPQLLPVRQPRLCPEEEQIRPAWPAPPPASTQIRRLF